MRDEESTKSIVNLGDAFLGHSDDVLQATFKDRSRGEL